MYLRVRIGTTVQVPCSRTRLTRYEAPADCLCAWATHMFLRAISHRSTKPSSNLQHRSGVSTNWTLTVDCEIFERTALWHSHKICDAVQSSLCGCTTVEQSKSLCLQLQESHFL